MISNRPNFNRLKKDFPEPKNFEINMGLKGLKRGTTISIGTPSDSK
jgi:hypothetical protein